jgi:hypothetical protein
MNDGQRKLVALMLAACGVIVLAMGGPGTPHPGPQPDGGLVLRGKFVGMTAAEDAATLAAYAEELASEIEHDGMSPEPFFKSGVHFDELRTRTRILFCRGQSIGDRQPKVRDILDKYLTDAVGTSGGPIAPEDRAKWVSAYREIGRAAADASR